jgi:ATP-dependent Clp protease adaptor protein ClpS
MARQKAPRGTARAQPLTSPPSLDPAAWDEAGELLVPPPATAGDWGGEKPLADLIARAEGVVTVASPDNHGDREAEDGGEGRPAKGDQHRGEEGFNNRHDTRADPSNCGSVMVVTTPAAVQDRELLRQPYPNYRVIVLDDDVNTFQHVVEALVRHVPAMNPDRAWQLAHRIDEEGSAVVWSGPQEQAELYHQLLAAEGLTMAPLERA